MVPIRRIFRTYLSHFVKNTHIEYMSIPHIDKIPPKPWLIQHVQRQISLLSHFVKNTHEEYMRIPHIDKISPKSAAFCIRFQYFTRVARVA